MLIRCVHKKNSYSVLATCRISDDFWCHLINSFVFSLCCVLGSPPPQSCFPLHCSACWSSRIAYLHCRDGKAGFSNKVSNIIRKYIDNMMSLLIYSLGSTFCQCMYGCITVQHCNLCIFIVMSMYSMCMFMYLHRASWHFSATLTGVFPCFFLSYKANVRVKPAKMGHGPHSSKFLFFCVLFVLCRSVYCLCVNVYCTTATGRLPSCS